MIRAASPSITALEKKYVLDALVNGWGKNMNKYIEIINISNIEEIVFHHLSFF